MSGAAALQPLQTLEGHFDRVWHVAWSPTGDTLASCSADKTVRLWQRRAGAGESWRCTAILEDAHSKAIRHCSWSPNGRDLLCASFDGVTSVWHTQAGIWEQASTIEGHDSEVKCAAWSPCGNYVATCGRDRTVWFWEALPGHEFACLDVKHGHTQDVKHLAWHPRQPLLASASYDDTIKLWVMDAADWVCAQTLDGPTGHTGTVWCVAFTSQGSHLASCSGDCTVKLWRCAFNGGQPCFTLATTLTGYHQRTIYSCCWSADDVLATGDESNSIKLFVSANPLANGSSHEQQQQQQQQQLVPPAGAAAAADDGDRSSSPAAMEGVVALPEPGWGLLLSHDQAHAQDVNCVAWHPRDALLASAGDDGVVKLWRLCRPEVSGG